VPPYGSEVIDVLPALQLRDDVVFFGQAVGGDQDRDMLSDGFVGRIAEDALGGPVPACDDAAQGLAQDRVVRRLHDL
jgi:hypothetical protein